MAAFLIGYDLNKPAQNYTGLIEAIKRLGNGSWWHHLDSTWIIKSQSSAVAIRDALLPYIDKNDELLVVKLTNEAAWWGFNMEGSNWLKSQL